jgi:hypothetical protein
VIENRIVAIVLAGILMLSCIPCCWAADVALRQEGPGAGANTAAAITDMVYVPGKAATCATSGVLWAAGMLLTVGMIYKQAGDFVHWACTGKWVLTGEDMVGPAKP